MSKPLNILVLLSDDHGKWALPAYGNRELRTPSLDHLARTGVVFDNAMTPSPVCSPARASFFTGMMPSQHGVHDYLAAAPQFHNQDWLAGLPTLPQLLADAGYACGFSGKWHLGRDEMVQPGFEDWFALSGDYPIPHKGAYRYSDNGWITTLNGYMTQHIADRTVEFLRRQRADRPFFHFTGLYATHSPWADQPDRLVSSYRTCSFADIPEAPLNGGRILSIESGGADMAAQAEARAQYYASVSAVDEAVGRILDTLETSGLLENTLVIYTSDHGLALGHHGIWGKGNATAPQNLNETSIGVPMILAAPEHLPAGARRAEFVSHPDLFRTILDAAQVPTPEGPQAGRSLLDLFAGRAADWRQEQIAEYGTARIIRTATHKLVKRYDGRPDELFCLTSDEGEARNIAEHEEAQEIRAALSQTLEARFNALGCAVPDAADYYGANRFNAAEAWR